MENKNVIVRKSEWIPGIGNGLFALKNIEEGAIVCAMSTKAECFRIRGKEKKSQDELEISRRG